MYCTNRIINYINKIYVLKILLGYDTEDKIG